MIEYSYTREVLEYSKDMKESERQAYVNKVYRFLMALLPGTKVLVDKFCKAKTRDLFIEVVKMFIQEQEWGDVVFSEDYQSIKKYET